MVRCLLVCVILCLFNGSVVCLCVWQCACFLFVRLRRWVVVCVFDDVCVCVVVCLLVCLVPRLFELLVCLNCLCV